MLRIGEIHRLPVPCPCRTSCSVRILSEDALYRFHEPPNDLRRSRHGRTADASGISLLRARLADASLRYRQCVRRPARGRIAHQWNTVGLARGRHIGGLAVVALEAMAGRDWPRRTPSADVAFVGAGTRQIFIDCSAQKGRGLK